MRALGIDVGSARVGLALSDELGITAGPLEVVPAGADGATALDRVAAICEERDVDVVVIGLPLSLDGGERGLSARRARRFGARLATLVDAEIVYRDERFTTAEADRLLVSSGVRRDRRKQVVDKISAALILQGYLDARASAP